MRIILGEEGFKCLVGGEQAAAGPRVLARVVESLEQALRMPGERAAGADRPAGAAEGLRVLRHLELESGEADRPEEADAVRELRGELDALRARVDALHDSVAEIQRLLRRLADAEDDER